MNIEASTRPDTVHVWSHSEMASRIREHVTAHLRLRGRPRLVVVGGRSGGQTPSPTGLVQALSVLHEMASAAGRKSLVCDEAACLPELAPFAQKLGYRIEAEANLDRALVSCDLVVVVTGSSRATQLHHRLAHQLNMIAIATLDDAPGCAEEPHPPQQRSPDLHEVLALRPVAALESGGFHVGRFVERALAHRVDISHSLGVSPYERLQDTTAVNNALERIPFIRSSAMLAGLVTAVLDEHEPDLVLLGDRKNDLPGSATALALALAAVHRLSRRAGSKRLLLQRAPQVMRGKSAALKPDVLRLACSYRGDMAAHIPVGLDTTDTLAWYALANGFELLGHDPRGPSGPVDARCSLDARENVMCENIEHAMAGSDCTLVLADWFHLPALHDRLSAHVRRPISFALLRPLHETLSEGDHKVRRMSHLLSSPGVRALNMSAETQAPLDIRIFLRTIAGGLSVSEHSLHRSGHIRFAHPGPTLDA